MNKEKHIAPITRNKKQIFVLLLSVEYKIVQRVAYEKDKARKIFDTIPPSRGFELFPSAIIFPLLVGKLLIVVGKVDGVSHITSQSA